MDLCLKTPSVSAGESPCVFFNLLDRVKLKSLNRSPENRSSMSQATKVVLGTIGAAVVVGLLLLVAITVV